jgi:proprotein convertase subtilisin/kexin type 5
LLSTLCTLCNSTAHRQLSNSSCLCASSFFELSGQQECLPCFTGCLTCYGTQASNCYSCDNSTYFLNNTCYATCPTSYVNQSAPSRVCTPCPSNCLSCPASATLCAACNSPYFVFAPNSSYAYCVTECPGGYYQVNQSCVACQSPCLNCSALYTCLACVPQHFLASSFCYPCESTCLTCTASSALDCLTCVPNYLLLNGVCQKQLCGDTQYVQSTVGCQECTVAFPNSLTCLSTGPLTCQPGYLLANNSCLACSSVTGYTYDASTGSCKDYCGDGIIITSLCDDGNRLNGDGCSSVCTIEAGWSCPSNLCTLLASPALSLYSMRNYPVNHTIVMVVSLSVGVRLAQGNFALKFTSITNYQYSVYQLNSLYTMYQLVIVYYQSAQNEQLSISVNSPIARLLMD